MMSQFCYHMLFNNQTIFIFSIWYPSTNSIERLDRIDKKWKYPKPEPNSGKFFLTIRGCQKKSFLLYLSTGFLMKDKVTQGWWFLPVTTPLS